MKFSRNTVIITALALMLIAGVAVSQTVAKTHMHRAQFGFDEHMLGFMTDYLDLTETQQAQVKEILSKAKPTIQPLIDQLRQGHQELMQLETGASFDEGKVRALAAQHTQAMTELMVQRARIHNEIFQLLTPEQKSRAIKLMNRHQQHMMEHTHQGPSSGGI